MQKKNGRHLTLANKGVELPSRIGYSALMFPLSLKIILGSKGWCSGESTCLSSVWPGFKSQCWHHIWVEFVVGSLPCSKRFFSGYSGFPLSSKTNISKFQFDQESGRWRTTLWMCYLQIIIYLFISCFWQGQLASRVPKSCLMVLCQCTTVY